MFALINKTAHPSAGFEAIGSRVLTIEFLVPFFTSSLLILCACLSISSMAPPDLVPDTAPLTDFSSRRAMRHLSLISREPHPSGTHALHLVRDYIVRQITDLGIEAEVQKTSLGDGSGEIGNIVARLKGFERGGAILLAAHYDSVPTSPGAGDNGSGVAALLETLRAVRAGDPLKNDLIFLFTDGEEQGLLGARSFVSSHPWAKDAQVVFNFDARGASGPSLMFQTSSENGWLIEQFAIAAPHPAASSLTADIYKLLPNQTDFTVFRKSGLAGLDFAFIDGFANYHTMADTVANIDEGSVQHQGSYALALARHFGNLKLDVVNQPNAIYFSTFGILLSYPQSRAMPLTALAALLFLLLIVLVRKRRRLKLREVGYGFLAVPASMIATLVMTTAVSTLFEETTGNAVLYSEWRTYAVGLIAATALVTATFQVRFFRYAGVEGLTSGGLLAWLILSAVTSLFVPGGSYLFTWPLLSMLVGSTLIFGFRKSPSSPLSVGFFSLFAVPAVILQSPITHVLFVGLGKSGFGIAMLFVVLITGLIVPHQVGLLARRQVPRR